MSWADSSAIGVESPGTDIATSSGAAPDNAPEDNKRRQQVKVACNRCKRMKLKCTGDRPSCPRCSNRGEICTYDDIPPGTTRSQHLAAKVAEQTHQLEMLDRELQMFRLVLDFMRSSTLQEAEELLSKLRGGEQLPQLAERVWRIVHATESDPQNRGLPFTAYPAQPGEPSSSTDAANPYHFDFE